MGIPVVTREYNPRACPNSRKTMSLLPRHEIRPDYPALHADHLFCMMWIAGWLWGQCKGNWPHLNLILGTPSNLHPGVTSVFFSSCDSVVGDSLEFNQVNRGSLRVCWENAIALDTMQGNRASSRREGKVSWVFSR